MTTLLTQTYLREYGAAGLDRLAADYAIKVRRSDDGRVLLKYDQIASPLAEPMVQECRGLVLAADDWRVLSWPFRKFFNHGEGHAAPIDSATARAEEKVDGTCCTLYWWRGEWRVQTLGMLDAEGSINADSRTFADLFWSVAPAGLRRELQGREHSCWTFELATRYNRVVTRYDADRLVLLSARTTRTLKEWGHEHLGFMADVFGAERPKAYPFASLDSVAAMARELPALEEGYVVVDGAFNRVKVKNPAYLAIAHLKESAANSLRSLVRLALTNEGEEFLSYFPEYRGDYESVVERIDRAAEDAERIYAGIADAPDQKAFALAVQASRTPLPAALYQKRRGNVGGVREWLTQQEPDKVCRWLGIATAEAPGEGLTA